MELAPLEMEKTSLTESKKQYPNYEDLTFRANVTSEAEALELLVCIQAIVNFAGAQMVIRGVRAVEKDPSIIQKAMSALPLLKLMP